MFFGSALLATALKADRLVLLTNVDAVFCNWNTDKAKPIERASASELRALAFEQGTMAPKIEAACQFATATGNPAYIGQLNRLPDILSGRSGTMILNE